MQTPDTLSTAGRPIVKGGTASLHRFNSAMATAQNYLRYVDDPRPMLITRMKLIELAAVNVRRALGAANEMRNPSRKILCLKILNRLRSAAARAKRSA